MTKTQAEADNLFMWLLSGAVDYYKCGKIPPVPKSVLTLKEASITENDTVSKFIADMCQTVTEESFKSMTPAARKEYTTETSILNTAFNRYTTENDLPTYPRGYLAGQLDAKGFPQTRTTSRAFKYIRLHPVEEEESPPYGEIVSGGAPENIEYSSEMNVP